VPGTRLTCNSRHSAKTAGITTSVNGRGDSLHHVSTVLDSIPPTIPVPSDQKIHSSPAMMAVTVMSFGFKYGLPTDVDLVDLAREIASRSHRRSGRTVRVIPPAIGVARATLRAQQADRAVGNLVDNALKFSTGDVEIVVLENGIEVRDHGPGIAEADKSRVFDRFWRADASRALPGSGLGLAIVKQFADDHDATVEVTDAPGGGAAVAIRFPSPR